MLQPYIRRYKELGVGPEVDVVIDSNPTIARHLSDGELDVAIMECGGMIYPDSMLRRGVTSPLF